MREIVRLPKAEEDLVRIWQYIAEDNEAAADRLLDRVSEIAQKLSAYPEAGRPRPELADGVRSFVVGNYVIFYKPMPSQLIVVRVLSRYLDIDGDDVQAD